jgi:cytochrome c553
MPKYRFWNGKSDNYLLGDVARLDAKTGTYPTSRPMGSVQDGKLYPFKYKTAEQPMASGSNLLIALDTKVFFATADPVAATTQGLINMGLSGNTPWEWVTTDTFQLLNHQVSTKEQALQCTSCHGTTNRMNLKGELGYQIKGSQATTCTQCHGIKENKPFQTIHDLHVKDKGYDCSWCHTFSRPERGLRTP